MFTNKILLTVIALSVTSGCQLADNAKNLSDRGGVGAFSCAQISSVFSAYQADKTSVDAYIELAKITGLSTENVTTQTVDTYYQTAKERANIALLVQGCPTL